MAKHVRGDNHHDESGLNTPLATTTSTNARLNPPSTTTTDIILKTARRGAARISSPAASSAARRPALSCNPFSRRPFFTPPQKCKHRVRLWRPQGTVASALPTGMWRSNDAAMSACWPRLGRPTPVPASHRSTRHCAYPRAMHRTRLA